MNKKWKVIYLAIRKRILLALRGRFFVISRGCGLVFLVDILNYIDRQIEAYGSYEAIQISQLLRKISEHKATLFLDIGANLGLYCIIVAKSYPDCEIVAFEPDRRNFCQLHANLLLNGLEDRVRVENFAVSAATGSARFARHDSENRGRSRISEDGVYIVETRRLDELFPMTGRRIVLKIDVEGHEQDVIAGALGLLAKNDCTLQIESFASEGIERQLAMLGYRLTGRVGYDLLFEKAAVEP